jgi:hypothetical protein
VDRKPPAFDTIKLAVRISNPVMEIEVQSSIPAFQHKKAEW